jgi:hypothetical protein
MTQHSSTLKLVLSIPTTTTTTTECKLPLSLLIEAKEKYFYSYKLPTGQTFKTEILTALRNKTTVEHDITIDKVI